MSDIAIRAENLGKQYRIGGRQAAYKTIRETISDAFIAPFRKARNLLRGQATGTAGLNETIWALKDVSFEVKRGEVVGIIGRNGAGKTTLLKVLSQITEPTEGYVDIYGRVGSLLEVGTGFHHELTGRENVYLNGAILGMRREEIHRKFDEIVAFSGVEKFIDTPVKHYSSGMYVRLAFAVAAHMEPEILLVDEVLAVGDAAFQKKCLGKMGEVARGGRTVCFVSHNMSAITRICQWAIRLDKGKIVDQDSSHAVVERYLSQHYEQIYTVSLPPDPSKPMRLRKLTVLNKGGAPSPKIEMSEPFRVRVEYDVNKTVTAAHVICFFHTSDGVNVFGTGDADIEPKRLEVRQPGYYCGEYEVPAYLLGEGRYTITVSLSIPFGSVYDRHSDIVSFSIVDMTSRRRQWQHRRRPGILGIELPWSYSTKWNK